MANSPPDVYLLDYATNREVRILMATQLLDPTPVGQPLGTGTPGAQGGVQVVASAEVPPAQTWVQNRIVWFLDDLYALITGTNGGIFKRNQGGADQWGRVLDPADGGATGFSQGETAGLHVLHLDGVPTLVHFFFRPAGDIEARRSTDGVTWGATEFLFNLSGTAATGQAITFRNSIFWWFQTRLVSYDFKLNTPSDYQATGWYSIQDGSAPGLCVIDNVVFASGWAAAAPYYWRLAKLQAGAFVQVYDDITRGAGVGQVPAIASNPGHHAMFRDPATGDLICFVSGIQQGGLTTDERTEVFRVQNPTSGSPTVTVISSTVLGSVEGADKYLANGGANVQERAWFVYVDNDTDPANPRVFLWTWDPATNVTECWEWTGVGTEVELVGLGAGFNVGVFSFPDSPHGGGDRSVVSARIEIGDPSNQDFEDTGGRRFYWRAYGSGGPFVGTFYVDADENAPSTVAPIVPASLVVESGVPATSPSILGNTITNITPDDGTVLYSVALDLSAVSIGSGAPGRLMGDLV